MEKYEEDESERQAAILVAKMFNGLVSTQCGELTMRQMAILLESSHRPIGASEIADKLGISKSSVSRSCDFLEKNNLARRSRQSPDDSRRVSIEPTPQGLALIGKALNCVAKNIE
jgi:DNA-binding MarR family transcriptional regulator